MAAEWQWSSPDGKGRDFLWIPPDCRQVRAVVICNHNMIEQGILEHPQMRETLSELGMAEVWCVPVLDQPFDFNAGAGKHLEKVLNALADESGYEELKIATLIPLGHSASATFPWNCAAWNPGRTLAILSIHGDAPQTNRTGYGRPNIPWGNRTIDGVPGLMVMGEYEWGEERLAPALAFESRYPASPIAFLADAGHGHFDYSIDLISFLCMFIRKAAEARLPALSRLDEPPVLKPIDPTKGWLIERWHKDTPPSAPAAPYAEYGGDRTQALWCLDKEMADVTEQYYRRVRGKRPQLIAFVADRKTYSGEPCSPPLVLESDGVTFHLHSEFLDKVIGNGENPSRWAGLPNGSPLGHAKSGRPIVLSPIVGPVVKLADDTFQIHLDRKFSTTDRRNNDIWILASHPGDDQYKSAVQQALFRLQPNKEGRPQKITFPNIPDQPIGTKTVSLNASSDAGLPVHYFVREGPAEVEGNTLTLLPIPPRAKFPVRVTVFAWQWGRGSDPKVQTAPFEEVSFNISPRR
jgi:hypothetical protein